MLEQFHFLEPLWLLAFIPLAVMFWLAFQTHTDSRAWEKIIDANLLPLLLQGKDSNKTRFPKFLLAMAWCIAVIALADPVWEKVPRPIFQTNAARVLVLDLSNSMLIDDIKPSRIARARFKIEDILSREEEGQTGLVLFAGEAFTAAPLTRDTETIRSMLKVLTPQIMPAQGSRVDLGLAKAHELMKQAGIVNGQILLIADGVSQINASIKAARELFKDGHTVSVLAVGTENGGKLNFRNNVSKLIKLDSEALENIAKSGGGNYRLMTSNNTDLKSLLNPITDNSSLENKQEYGDNNLQNSDWYSTGPFLAMLILPFAALAFRKGWLLNIAVAFITIGLLAQPQEVLAADEGSQSNWNALVERLSKNKAQRANDALLKKQYEKAKDLSEDPLARGSAEYKLEDYENALSSFQESQGVTARYNEGNTHAKLENYEEALAAYDRALKLDPTMQDALDNKKAIEDFLKQQKQSGKEGESSNENQQGNSDSKNDEQNQESGDSQDKQDQQSGSQSANEGGEQEQQKDQKQDDEKSQENQFSDANEDLDKNKKDAEEEELEAAQSKSDQKNGDNDDEKSQALKDNEVEQANKQEESEYDSNKRKDELKEAAEELTQEEKMAAEQWLRRIPDDPGGLLRRKFRYQYNQNRRNLNSNSSSNATEQPW